jgi:rhamnosyltransferase
MRHALGNARNHRILWRDFAQSHHATFRRYYITRNRLLTLRTYALREPRWALSRLRAMVLELFTVPLLESDRWAKLRAMSLGLWHGILGRSGKADRSF